MKTEIIISSHDATQAMRLIWEYLEQGGTGFDADALARVSEALSEADRIVIETDEQRAEREGG
jgi:hypothetical protein